MFPVFVFHVVVIVSHVVVFVVLVAYVKLTGFFRKILDF